MICEFSTVRDALGCLIEVMQRQRDWVDYVALLVLPVLSTGATAILAFVSWRTSVRATRISEVATNIAAAALRAEEARDAAEHQRVTTTWQRDYEARLDAHFAAFVEAIGQYGAAHDRWLDDISEIDMTWNGNPDDAPYPPRPSRALLDSRLLGVMMHAREDDRIPLGAIDGYVRAVMRSPSLWKQTHRMTYLAEVIRPWRDGSCTANTFMNRLKRKRSTVDFDRDTPPRRGDN